MSKFDELGYALRRSDITVPGFTKKVLVRELTTGEWADVLAAEAAKQKVRLVSLAVLTPNGEPAFDKDDPDTAKLGAAAIDSIVLQVSGMNQASEDAAKN
jgi:hypothetical protein